MRITTLLRRLLDVSQTVVRDVRVEERALVVEVAPTWRRPRCGKCLEPRPGYDRPKAARRWRDIPFGCVVLLLEAHLRRVDCPTCGVVVEHVPWAAHGSRFTLRLEELGAYLATATDKTTVSNILGVTWRAVDSMVERVVRDGLDPQRLEGLKRIGVDEFSYRKRHRYITVIVNHDTGDVVWATKGKGADALKQFFEELGPERVALLETATIDMAGGYKAAFKEHAPHVQITFDRFHVQRLAHDALDSVRRELWRELKGAPEGKAIKGSRFSMHRRERNQTERDRKRLSDIQKSQKPLFRAYLLKETLAASLDIEDPDAAEEQLRQWLGWASRSRLKPFVKAARTIRAHFDGICAYLKERLTNGIVEGLNNKLRTVARRAFGFHTPEALIAMLFLCCGGLTLTPPIPAWCTH